MKVTLIPGDGIGPEIVESVKKIFIAAGVPIEWEEINAGISVMDDNGGNPLPEALLESIRKNKFALKAPLTTPVGTGFRSVNVSLRKELDLYANIRPINSIEGVETPFKNVHITIVRENTEGLYSGVEHYVGKDAAETIKIITRSASERIGRYALELQKWRNIISPTRLTIVHKANIQKFTDGLFLESVKSVHEKEYGGLFNVDDKIIDNMCMQLVQRPQTFDIIVAPNFYGDILSDLCAGLIGGLGVAPGANIGDECEVYEAIHGTAPDIAGKGIANPTSLILSATMMLKSMKMNKMFGNEMVGHGLDIESAVLKTIKEGKFLTSDLGGNSSTMEFTDAIISNIRVK